MESGEHSGHVLAFSLTWACKLACMHAICLCALTHFSAKVGQIRELKASIESREHARPKESRGTSQSWLWCLSTCTHASMHTHYFLMCLGPYLSQIGSDQKDHSISGIRRICGTCLSTYFDLSMQAFVQARFVLECTGPYLSEIG